MLTYSSLNFNVVKYIRLSVIFLIVYIFTKFMFFTRSINCSYAYLIAYNFTFQKHCKSETYFWCIIKFDNLWRIFSLNITLLI